MPNSRADALKSQENQFFKSKQYASAVQKYIQATEIDPTQPSYWSNMAACYEKMGQYEDMAKASQDCIKANKSFVKGYFRLATAYKAMNDLPACIKALESGLAIQASNPDLKRMKKDVVELQRGENVAAMCRQAEEQMLSGDIPGAYKTLELASRQDAGNPDIERMMKKVKPRYEAMERKRKASLSATEIYKERGDEAYRQAKFEEAIELYTKCIDSLKKERKMESELALKALSNRAACHKQISNFDAVIEDSTAVLEIDPENTKALIRRAQAFEAVERYRFALQDVKTVLTMPYEKVGKSNFDLCNGLQHRLNRTVTQLKAMS